MIQAAFFGNRNEDLERVYRSEQRARINQLCSLHPEVVNEENLSRQLPLLENLEVIFSTWGMPYLNADNLRCLPSLKAVFYAAGSVKKFAQPLLDHGVLVVSGWAANAVPVAEFTLAQILLSNKGYFRNIRDCASPSTRSGAFRGQGNFNADVSLLGAGMVGRKVIELMEPYSVNILVYDPFLSRREADELGVELVDLEEAFSRGMVVSNHLANVPETRRLLRSRHFAGMRENAVFINTGRGATAAEDELASVLIERSDLTALLDVTDPEPPTADSPLYDLPNVFLSSHIAGSIGGEVVRMADTMIEEFNRWREGQPLRYAVDYKMLAVMA